MDYQNEPSIVEETIIGCLLQNHKLINELYLQPKHFLNDNNRVILSKILDIKKKQGQVDIVLLCDELKDTYLQTLAMDYVENLVTVSDFHPYQEKQEERYKGYAINLILDKFNNRKIDYEEMIDSINKINSECNKVDTGTHTMASASEIFEMITTNSNTIEFDTYKALGNQLQIPTNTVNIIAARTSVGKSALSLNLANDLAKKYKIIYFNLEMTPKELYQRLVSINSNIAINDFYKINELNNSNDIWKGIEKLKNKNMKLYTGSKNLKAIRTILTKESRNEHCIAFIDYVGLVTTGKQNQGDTERIGEIMRELKRITADINCTIFAVAQINRDGANKEPCLENLKDSGELEQTGHCIMILHNPDNDKMNQTPEIKVFVLKNRSGRLGVFRMVFDKPTQRFIMQRKEG